MGFCMHHTSSIKSKSTTFRPNMEKSNDFGFGPKDWCTSKTLKFWVTMHLEV